MKSGNDVSAAIDNVLLVIPWPESIKCQAQAGLVARLGLGFMCVE